ncbi:MAG: TatD family hydrolase [Candidatus Bathyarchaeota archaeon]|nr:MAG: TatD family hydrolase [Candidatus Bathyarchaeota archaeon]
MLSDAHAHLYRYSLPSTELETAMTRAKTNQVRIILAAGTDVTSSAYTVTIAELYDSVYACVGIHPWYANTYDEKAYRQLLQLTNNPQVIAISEVCLDYVTRRESPSSPIRRNDYQPQSVQINAFRRQIDLAIETQLPLIIHHNQSHSVILDTLQQYDPTLIRGAIHGFYGDSRTATQYLNLGLFLSIGARSLITPEREPLLRQVLLNVPLNRLLIETDSNDPAGVQVAAEKIAEIKNIDPETVGTTTTKNLQTLLGI